MSLNPSLTPLGVESLIAALREAHIALMKHAAGVGDPQGAIDMMQRHEAVIARLGSGAHSRYMTVNDGAAYLRRTPKAIRCLVDRREIPFAKVGGRVQFDRERIDRWMERHTRRAVAE